MASTSACYRSADSKTELGITGLQNPFDPAYYKEVRWSIYTVENGGTLAPDPIESVYPTAGNTRTEVWTVRMDTKYAEYQIYGYAQTTDGRWWSCGSDYCGPCV